jgi:hypothetical protein
MYLDYILSKQLSDGGFALSGTVSDPDITATVLQALSAYTEDPAVYAASEKALACLSRQQNGEGGYSSYGDENVESCAQVVIALCSLGISPEDPDFVKNGHSVLDSLLQYQTPEGGFSHTEGGPVNAMSTEQGLCALAALDRLNSGKSGLYAISKGLPGKGSDVRRVLISAPGTALTDIAGNKNKDKIRALTEREIITGMGDGTFSPDGSMTRAQFAAITVRCLGLDASETSLFSDVPQGKWYSGYIGTAFSRGIIKGRTDDIFDPEGPITNQEAAVMVARAAALFGLDTSLTDEASHPSCQLTGTAPRSRHGPIFRFLLH